MSYFKLAYIFLFLPLVVIVYNFTPKKFKFFILLIASIIFFSIISKWLIIFMVLSIISIYLTGRLLNHLDNKKEEKISKCKKDEKKLIKDKYKKKKRLTVALAILFNFSFLFFFKYLNFFLTNTNIILDLFNIDYSFIIVKHLAPIGISYYTLSAISYIMDIYNGKIEAEKNIFKVSLYLMFFPTLMEGPIARFGDLKETLFSGNKITYKSFCFGYQRILFGLFKKLVIADRINIVVKTVFSSYASLSGPAVWLGVIFYTIMLYAEFSGTMDIVIGSGEIFGVKMPENFRQPFFAKNVSEFWTRWHITLGAWFKDYIYFPVSLSKPMKKLTTSARKHLGNHFGPLLSGAVALFCVWFLNGLWHGAGYNYLFFGLYHFALILLGSIFEYYIVKLCQKWHINRANIFYRIFQSIKMTIFIFIGELFFRAPTLHQGFSMLKQMLTNFSFSKSEFLSLGIDIKDYIIVLIALVFIFIISLLKEKNINIREKISEKKIFVRWPLYYALILGILIFGAYGPGYAPVDPIYADF